MFTMTLAELRDRHESSIAESGTRSDRSAFLSIDDYGDDLIVASASFLDGHTRPGGTIAGPVLMTMVDTIGFMVTIAQAPPGTETFTTDISMQFLRPAPMGLLVVEGRPLRFGKRSSVISATVRSPQVHDGPVATAVVTFAPVFPQL